MMKNSFEIYATDRGVIEENNNLKLRILSELSKRNMTLSEISKILNQPQSTLLAYMNDLIEEHVVRIGPDSNDGRRKIYMLDARLVMRNKDTNTDAAPEVKRVMSRVVDEDLDLDSGLLRSFFLFADIGGLDITPFLYNLGCFIGDAFLEKYKGSIIEDIIGKVCEFFKKNKMGEIYIYTFLPLTVVVSAKNTYVGQCDLFSTLCQGIFKSILDGMTGKSHLTEVIDRFGENKDKFKFVIRLANESDDRSKSDVKSNMFYFGGASVDDDHKI